MSVIKIVNESKYTEKYKVGDLVKIAAVTELEVNLGLVNPIGRSGIITSIAHWSESFPYVVELSPYFRRRCNEATLELVSEGGES